MPPVSPDASPKHSTESREALDPITMAWPTSTTKVEAIERAMYSLAAELSGTVAEVDENWQVSLYPTSARCDRVRLAHRMRQEVTDHALRLRIAERTDPVRNLVFAMAFSRSPLGVRPSTLDGDSEAL